MTKRSINKRSGFTLIELIVVVVVLGVLAAMALMQYTKTVEIQRYRSHLRNLVQLKGKLQQYYYTNKSYPSASMVLGQLNAALGTDIDDPLFAYQYESSDPESFELGTGYVPKGLALYNCRIDNFSTYPSCSGTLPE